MKKLTKVTLVPVLALALGMGEVWPWHMASMMARVWSAMPCNRSMLSSTRHGCRNN